METVIQSTLKIAIVDDHEMFRSGLKLILSQNENIEIVFEAENGKELLQFLQKEKPDIILMDINMPLMNGYETTIKSLEIHPGLKIIAVSMLDHEIHYTRMIKAGVIGFVLKSSGTKELNTAINEVSKGNTYFALDLLRQIALKTNDKKAKERLLIDNREIEVLNAICNGFTTKEIAEKLCLSTKSIEKYKTRLLQKTKAKNSAHLVKYVFQNNLIELYDCKETT